MDDEQIRDATRDIVAEILELDTGELRDEAPFSELGADSIQQMEIIAALRTRFGVRYSLNEEGQLVSVDHSVTITRVHLPR